LAPSFFSNQALVKFGNIQPMEVEKPKQIAMLQAVVTILVNVFSENKEFVTEYSFSNIFSAKENTGWDQNVVSFLL
jgi:hypothetical protein